MILFALYVESRLTMSWNTFYIGTPCVHEYASRRSHPMYSLPILFHEMKQTTPMRLSWLTPQKMATSDHSTFELRHATEGMKEPSIYERRMLRLFHYMMQFSIACTIKRGPQIKWTILWDIWKTGRVPLPEKIVFF
jgi:hypothetical protein